MYSMAEGLKHFKVHLAKSNSLNLTITTSKNLATTNADSVTEWWTAFVFLARLSAYIAVLALTMLVVFLIMKYITDTGDESSSDEVGSATETNPLRQGKAMAFTYGTCNIDLESGCCNASSGDNNSSSSKKASAELYDAKLCVICYDEERNCFFVPCGHCATCYICARRILNEENKVCPVCRRFIGKVRKLFA
ncbi:hypothetical protein P3X46_012558 [Hevea brasiliensis]|uniref:RING-type domain-containing protein n=1 Tax=Hevea brasiliensis TaxID=3981 RepID=A0ABQ9MEB7_HEVBR|nr:hypothetical protein P3X46_012558 [Hevea brasiliensis]